MCGIIGYVGLGAAKPRILAGLGRLEHRGYDSAEIAVSHRGEVRVARAVGNLAALRGHAGSIPEEATTGIGHTRWATHGRPTVENAHPLRGCDGRLAVAMNGIVENFHELRLELGARGHRFRSQTDAEVIAHLVEEHDHGDLVEAVAAACGALSGHFAFVVCHRDHPHEVAGARRACPLVAGLGGEGTLLSSMSAALTGMAESVVPLEDGEIVRATPAGIEVYDEHGGRVVRAARPIEAGEEVGHDGHGSFMRKEIFEQPQAVRRTLDGAAELPVLRPSRLAGIERIIIVGCGTAYHAGLCGAAMIEEWAGLPCHVQIASEWRYRRRFLPPGTVVVAVSQSGETADTLAAAQAARADGVPVVALTNVAESQLAREADELLLTRAGWEAGVAATKTFTAQVALLAALALRLAAARGAEVGAAEAALGGVDGQIARFLSSDHPTGEIAARLCEREFFLYLGRQTGLPVALEGALKLKELAYVPADAYAAGEMKHGPIALLSDETPVVVVATDSNVYDKVISNIAEVRARGASVVAIASDRNEEIQHHADDVIYVPRVDPLLAPVVAVLPLQLFAHDVAARRGLDVDRPRNLAKTVTVE